MDRLTFAYEPDPADGIGRLSASVVTSNFSGRCKAWAQVENLEEFAAALSNYPLSSDVPTEILLGYAELQGEDVMLSVRVYAADPRGGLTVSVELADDGEPRSRLRTHFVTHYPDVERFAGQLRRLGSFVSEAVLEGS